MNNQPVDDETLTRLKKSPFFEEDSSGILKIARLAHLYFMLYNLDCVETCKSATNFHFKTYCSAPTYIFANEASNGNG